MFKFNVILDTAPAEKWASVVTNTDFKAVLRFFRLLDDEALNEDEKAECIAKIFWDGLPPDKELWEGLLDFIACGEERTGSSGKKTMCYNVDHGRIFAAFLQAYNIDLRITDMHWWVFCELLNALPEDTKFMQIIELRGRKPAKGDSDEYKRNLRKLQKAYRIENADDGDALGRFFDRL